MVFSVLKTPPSLRAFLKDGGQEKYKGTRPGR